MEKKKLNNWQVLMLAVLPLIPLCATKPEILNDTKEYLTFSSFRPPIYPIFLWLFHFAGPHQMYIAMWIQTIINLACLVLIGNWFIRRHILVNPIAFIIVFTTTYIFYVHNEWSETMLSEMIAFPIFLLFLMLFIDCMNQFNLKKLSYLCIACNMLILTREQFYFLYLLLIFLIIFYITKHYHAKKIIMSFLIIFLSCSMFNSLNRFYHYVFHHHFRDTSVMGEMIYYKAFYFSDIDDLKYFKNPDEGNFFKDIITKYKYSHLTHISAQQQPLWFGSTYLDNYYYHIQQSRQIAKGILQTDLRSFSVNTKDYTVNDLLVNVSKVLLLHHLKINVKFAIWKTGIYLGNIYILISFLIVILSFIIRSIIDYTWNPDFKTLFVFCSVLIITTNALFVAIFAHYEPRFFIYSYFIYFCLAAITADHFFTTKPLMNTMKFGTDN